MLPSLRVHFQASECKGWCVQESFWIFQCNDVHQNPVCNQWVFCISLISAWKCTWFMLAKALSDTTGTDLCFCGKHISEKHVLWLLIHVSQLALICISVRNRYQETCFMISDSCIAKINSIYTVPSKTE